MNKKGFSLIEILIYSTLIAIVGSFLGGILISVTKIQNKQAASTEVNQQLNFVLQNIHRLIRESSAIDIPATTPVSSLTLRMEEPLNDPTLIYLSDSAVYLKVGSADPVLLTSTTTTKIDDLKFTRISAFPGHNSVQIDLVMSYNTENPERQFTRSITSAVARVSAATFDSDLIPGATNSYDIGLSSTKWKDLNLSGDLSIAGNANISGETKVGGISGDGSGKVVCIKSNGDLGSCSNSPNSSGICTCN